MKRTFVVALALASTAFAQQRVDVLVRGGTIVDGTGAPGRSTDIGIAGDRITFIGDAAAAHIVAARTINASGLIVSPGFIDPHTHTLEDLSSPSRHGNENYLMQGVTTVLTGNDGGGPLQHLPRFLRPGLRTVPAPNAALYVGFGSVRTEVLGNADVAPNPEQLERMRGMVKKSMEDGAIGLSTGLFYSPQNFSEDAGSDRRTWRRSPPPMAE